MPRTRVLLTGAAGFVGSHVLEHVLVHTDWEVVCPVTMRHMGSWGRLARAIDRDLAYYSRVKTVVHDLTTPFTADELVTLGQFDVMMNVASESHVDRSLADPGPFVRNNVDLMTNVLELARRQDDLKIFLQMSTDEVYGPAPAGHAHREWETPLPSNPYSASKAAQEALAVAWWRSYGVPVVLTNTMNVFGETQDPEKFFAKVMRAVARGEVVPVHGQRVWDGTGHSHWVAGSRMWLHARNLADAWVWLARAVVDGEWTPPQFEAPTHEEGVAFGAVRSDRPLRLNVVGQREVDNLEMARLVAEAMDAGRDLRHEFVDFHASRPGHDLRYALDGSALAALGWTAPVSLEQGVEKTVAWTLAHPEWL